MSVSWDVVAIVVGVIAAAIAGGAFFAFSNFVMPALSRLSAPAGGRAMQQINRAAPSPGFVTALLVGVVAGMPVLVVEVDDLAHTETRWVAVAVASSALSFAITMFRNVPKNNALDAVDPDSSAGERLWQDYVPTWTRANTLRGVASMASAVAYALSLRGR